MEVDKQGKFFEKIAKLHENMDKMNDHEFGRALKLVGTQSPFIIYMLAYRLVKECRES